MRLTITFNEDGTVCALHEDNGEQVLAAASPARLADLLPLPTYVRIRAAMHEFLLAAPSTADLTVQVNDDKKPASVPVKIIKASNPLGSHELARLTGQYQPFMGGSSQR
jgi:hypothetical protein